MHYLTQLYFSFILLIVIHGRLTLSEEILGIIKFYHNLLIE